MTYIQPDRWYSVTELLALGKEDLLPISSRDKWIKLIKEGKLAAFAKAPDSKKKNYMVKGSEVIRFINNTIDGTSNIQSFQ